MAVMRHSGPKMEFRKYPSSECDHKYASQFECQSTSGREYVISVRPDGGMMCSCPQWTHRRKECKHLRAFASTFTHIGMDLSPEMRPFVIGADDEVEQGDGKAKSLDELLKERIAEDGDASPAKPPKPSVLSVLKSGGASWGLK